jgi:hypothetical protein
VHHVSPQGAEEQRLVPRVLAALVEGTVRMRDVYALAVTGLLAMVIGGGSLLSKLDRTQAEQRATNARARLHEARLELVRVQAIAHRDVKPASDPLVEVCVRRTDALRKAIFALVRTGTVSMPGDPGGEWITWR